MRVVLLQTNLTFRNNSRAQGSDNQGLKFECVAVRQEVHLQILDPVFPSPPWYSCLPTHLLSPGPSHSHMHNQHYNLSHLSRDPTTLVYTCPSTWWPQLSLSRAKNTHSLPLVGGVCDHSLPRAMAVVNWCLQLFVLSKSDTSAFIFLTEHYNNIQCNYCN